MVAVLAGLFILAIASQSVMSVVSQEAQREREDLLLKTGLAYAQAIAAYYESSPGTMKQWPRRLDDLIEDPRFVTLQRYLRQRYTDPVARSSEWGILRTPDGGIYGVHSLSEAAPIRTSPLELSVHLPRQATLPFTAQGGVRPQALSLPAATKYSDWEFVYRPRAPSAGGRS